jgi:hypothetical protein
VRRKSRWQRGSSPSLLILWDPTFAKSIQNQGDSYVKVGQRLDEHGVLKRDAVQHSDLKLIGFCWQSCLIKDLQTSSIQLFIKISHLF